MSTSLHATKRATSAVLAVASVLLLATCDLDKIVGSAADPENPVTIDPSELVLTGGTEVILGGTATVDVTSTTVDLSGVVKRYYSAASSIISVDSITGVMVGQNIGSAIITAKILAPELGNGVSTSRTVTVRYKGIRITSPVASDSIQGLGQTRTIALQGVNNSGANAGALSVGVTTSSTDSTIIRVLGVSVTARKGGSAYVVAVFDNLRDSVLMRVRQVAKSITYPTTDFTARHLNFNLAVPLTVRDVADSIIPTPSLTWRTKDTTRATVGASTGVLRVKSVLGDTVWAKMDTVERPQRIVVSQVVGSLTKFAGDARNDTVAKAVTVLPTVTALDSGSTAIVGASVTFRLSPANQALAGAAITDSVRTTDANGRASVGSWKLSDLAGSNTLQAVSGSATTTFTVTGVPQRPFKLGFAAQPVSTTVGVALSPAITVRVLDSLGNLISNATNSVTIALSNNPGSASLAGTLTKAAVNGVATFNNLSLNAGGSGYSFQASAAGLQSAISNGFDIFGTATKVAFTTQPVGTSAGATMSTVRVAVQDASGTTVGNSTASVTVGFSNNPGAATLSGTKTVSAVAGIATFTTLSVNNAGVGYTLEATAAGLTGGLSNPFTIVAVGAPSQLAFEVQPSNIVAGSAITPAIKVRVLDANGALVTSSTQQITLSIDASSPSGATLSGTPTRNAVAGVAVFDDITLNRSGTGYKLLAAASGTALTSATSTAFNVAAGTATSLGFAQQPTHTIAGEAIAPAVVVEVLDAAGNRVTGSSASITISRQATTGCTTPTLSGGGAQTASGGVATFSSLTLSATGTGCVLSATATGLGSVSSFQFNSVTATGPVKLAFTTEPSASTTAGVVLATAPVVTFQDASGNNVSASSTTINLTILSGPQSFFNAGGGGITTATTATFSGLRIDKAGQYRLLASATGFKPDTSQIITVNAAAAFRLFVLTQPSSGTAGVPFSPAMQIAVGDQFNNVVPGATNTATLDYFFDAGGPQAFLNTGTSQSVAAAVDGVATFTGLAPRTAGSMRICANTSGLFGTCTSIFSVTPAPLARLGFSRQPESFDTVTTAMDSIQVAGQDSVGNTVSDFSNAVTVALTGGAAGAVLGGTKTVAPVGGVATFTTLTVDRTGTGYQLSASASGVATATSSVFEIERLYLSTNNLCCEKHTLVGNTVYVVHNNALKSVPAAGGAVTTIVGSTNPRLIATDGTNIYWAERGVNNNGDAFIKKLTVSGSTVSTLTTGLSSLADDGMSRMYADGINVYFIARNIAGNGYAIRSVPVGASSVTPAQLHDVGFFSNPNFVLSGGLIYFFDPQTATIRRMATNGGGLTTLSTASQFANKLALVGTTLFYNDGVVIKSIPNATTASTAVTPTTHFTAPGTVWEVASGNGLLYLNIAGIIRRYDPANMTTFTVVDVNAVETSPDFLFDSVNLFFTDRFGRIARVPK